MFESTRFGFNMIIFTFSSICNTVRQRQIGRCQPPRRLVRPPRVHRTGHPGDRRPVLPHHHGLLPKGGRAAQAEGGGQLTRQKHVPAADTRAGTCFGQSQAEGTGFNPRSGQGSDIGGGPLSSRRGGIPQACRRQVGRPQRRQNDKSPAGPLCAAGKRPGFRITALSRLTALHAGSP